MEQFGIPTQAPMQAPMQPPMQPPMQVSMQPPMQPPMQQKKSKRPFFLSALIGLLCGGVLLGSLYLLGVLGGEKYEGNGFSSPEEAITTYLEAMRDCDAEEMLSTFAIETMVENFNFEAKYLYNDYYTLGYDGLGNVMLPPDSDFSYDLAVTGRAASLVEDVVAPFFMAAESKFENPDSLQNSDSVIIRSRADRNSFEKQHRTDDCADVLATLEIGEMYEDPKWEEWRKEIERYQEKYEEYLEIYGADDYRYYWVEVEIEGESFIFGMTVVCYDGTWYNLETGTLGMNPATAQNSGGFMPGE